MFEKPVEVKKLTIFLRWDEKTKTMIGFTHIAAPPHKRIFITPGKLASFEMIDQTSGVKKVAEYPIGPNGWEFELL